MRSKWRSAKHDASMLDVGRSRQIFRESISKHEMSTKSNEAKNTTKDQFPDEISADINNSEYLRRTGFSDIAMQAKLSS